MNAKSDKGLSLIEFLVVIVVVAIIAAIVILTYQGYQSKVRDDEYLSKIFRIGSVEYGSILETVDGQFFLVSSTVEGVETVHELKWEEIRVKDGSIFRIWNPSDSLYKEKYEIITHPPIIISGTYRK